MDDDVPSNFKQESHFLGKTSISQSDDVTLMQSLNLDSKNENYKPAVDSQSGNNNDANVGILSSLTSSHSQSFLEAPKGDSISSYDSSFTNPSSHQNNEQTPVTRTEYQSESELFLSRYELSNTMNNNQNQDTRLDNRGVDIFDEQSCLNLKYVSSEKSILEHIHSSNQPECMRRGNDSNSNSLRNDDFGKSLDAVGTAHSYLRSVQNINIGNTKNIEIQMSPVRTRIAATLGEDSVTHIDQSMEVEVDGGDSDQNDPEDPCGDDPDAQNAADLEQLDSVNSSTAVHESGTSSDGVEVSSDKKECVEEGIKETSKISSSIADDGKEESICTSKTDVLETSDDQRASGSQEDVDVDEGVDVSEEMNPTFSEDNEELGNGKTEGEDVAEEGYAKEEEDVNVSEVIEKENKDEMTDEVNEDEVPTKNVNDDKIAGSDQPDDDAVEDAPTTNEDVKESNDGEDDVGVEKGEIEENSDEKNDTKESECITEFHQDESEKGNEDEITKEECCQEETEKDEEVKERCQEVVGSDYHSSDDKIDEQESNLDNDNKEHIKQASALTKEQSTGGDTQVTMGAEIEKSCENEIEEDISDVPDAKVKNSEKKSAEEQERITEDENKATEETEINVVNDDNNTEVKEDEDDNSRKDVIIDDEACIKEKADETLASNKPSDLLDENETEIIEKADDTTSEKSDKDDKEVKDITEVPCEGLKIENEICTEEEQTDIDVGTNDAQIEESNQADLAGDDQQPEFESEPASKKSEETVEEEDSTVPTDEKVEEKADPSSPKGEKEENMEQKSPSFEETEKSDLNTVKYEDKEEKENNQDAEALPPSDENTEEEDICVDPLKDDELEETAVDSASIKDDENDIDSNLPDGEESEVIEDASLSKNEEDNGGIVKVEEENGNVGEDLPINEVDIDSTLLKEEKENNDDIETEVNIPKDESLEEEVDASIPKDEGEEQNADIPQEVDDAEEGADEDGIKNEDGEQNADADIPQEVDTAEEGADEDGIKNEDVKENVDADTTKDEAVVEEAESDGEEEKVRVDVLNEEVAVEETYTEAIKGEKEEIEVDIPIEEAVKEETDIGNPKEESVEGEVDEDIQKDKEGVKEEGDLDIPKDEDGVEEEIKELDTDINDKPDEYEGTDPSVETKESEVDISIPDEKTASDEELIDEKDDNQAQKGEDNETPIEEVIESPVEVTTVHELSAISLKKDDCEKEEKVSHTSFSEIPKVLSPRKGIKVEEDEIETAISSVQVYEEMSDGNEVVEVTYSDKAKDANLTLTLEKDSEPEQVETDMAATEPAEEMCDKPSTSHSPIPTADGDDKIGTETAVTPSVASPRKRKKKRKATRSRSASQKGGISSASKKAQDAKGGVSKGFPQEKAASRSGSSSTTRNSSAAAEKKIPPIKAPVGNAPPPKVKQARSKIGSLENVTHKPKGGEKKVESVKLEWTAKSKVGSLDYATHKPGGGDKKIITQKVDFKNVQSKVGSKDNLKHKPGGGNLKVATEKLDFKKKAAPRVGSLENAKHKPGGGSVVIRSDKLHFKEKATSKILSRSESEKGSSHGGSEAGSPVPPSSPAPPEGMPPLCEDDPSSQGENQVVQEDNVQNQMPCNGDTCDTDQTHVTHESKVDEDSSPMIETHAANGEDDPQ